MTPLSDLLTALSRLSTAIEQLTPALTQASREATQARLTDVRKDLGHKDCSWCREARDMHRAKYVEAADKARIENTE